MNAFVLILLYVVYVFLLVVVSYYVTLFTTKEEYTQEELKNVFPFFSYTWEVVSSKYSLLSFFVILVISSVLGMIVPFISKNWFLNSSILFIVIFFTVPYLRNYFEDGMVTESDNSLDTYANIFVKHSDLIVLGFGIGLGSALTYVWRNNVEISTIWFLINIIIVTVLLEISLKTVFSK